MSKIIKFLDKMVEFPLRWTADIDSTPTAITNLTRDPGTVYQAGTSNKAEYFNSIQENGVYSVDSTINVAGSVTTYTITNFLTEGTFNIYDGFKLSMKSAGNNVGVTKIDLLGVSYDVKLASNGSYIDTVNDDIKTNEIIDLEYRNGVFIFSFRSFLPKGEGLSEDYNTAKKIEDQIKKITEKTVLFDGLVDSLGAITLNDNWDNFEKIVFIGRSFNAVNFTHTIFYTDYIEPSDGTGAQTPGELRVYNVSGEHLTLVCRDTNRNEMYCNEIAAGRIEKIIGINKIN